MEMMTNRLHYIVASLILIILVSGCAFSKREETPTYAVPPLNQLPSSTNTVTETIVPRTSTATVSKTPALACTRSPDNPFECIRPYLGSYTQTHTPIHSPTATSNPLTAPKKHGYYRIGIEIAPGRWLSEAGQEDCYVILFEKDYGDAVSWYHGPSGVIYRLPDKELSVQFTYECGTWKYLGP